MILIHSFIRARDNGRTGVRVTTCTQFLQTESVLLFSLQNDDVTGDCCSSSWFLLPLTPRQALNMCASCGDDLHVIAGLQSVPVLPVNEIAMHDFRVLLAARVRGTTMMAQGVNIS